MIKSNTKRILILTNQLKITSGVSKHLLYFLQEVKNFTEVDFTIICGGGNSIEIFRPLVKEVLVWPFLQHENRTFRSFFKSIFKLISLQKIEKFDIFHSHNHYAANIAKITSLIFRVKTVQTVHGYIKPIGRLNHYVSDYFISVNEYIYDYLVKQKKKSIEKVILLRSGVPRKLVNKNKVNEKLRIISAGRLIPEKGFDVFIKAISKLKVSDLERAEFLIAGCGEYEMELKKLANEQKVQISFIGEVKDFKSFLGSTDIFVLASQSEGFPLVIVEAALYNNLIICSNFIGYDSILKDKINCLIFNIDDSEELAEKISYAINNYNNLDPMINNLLELVIKEFNLKKMVEKTLNFYNEILN